MKTLSLCEQSDAILISVDHNKRSSQVANKDCDYYTTKTILLLWFVILGSIWAKIWRLFFSHKNSPMTGLLGVWRLIFFLEKFLYDANCGYDDYYHYEFQGLFWFYWSPLPYVHMIWRSICSAHPQLSKKRYVRCGWTLNFQKSPLVFCTPHRWWELWRCKDKNCGRYFSHMITHCFWLNLAPE